MNTEEKNYITIGKIIDAHGLDGEARVFPLTDFPERFSLLKRVFLFFDETRYRSEVKVTNVRYHGKYVLIKFKGIDARTDIDNYKGNILKIPMEEAVPLDKNTYYIADLIGCDVYTQQEELIGRVKDVLSAGNDIIEVLTPEGKEVLIPFVNEFVPFVDTDAKKIVVKLIEGLMDL